MTMIRINAVGEMPVLHARPTALERGLDHCIDQGMGQVAQGSGPVIIMIHGYKYQPGNPRHCPHRHILAQDPQHMPWRAPSWPRQLGFGLGHRDEGLALAFGWDARGTLPAAQARAAEAGRALALVVRQLRAQTPHRDIHMIGHSLGTEVALEALHALPAGAVQRVISLTGASYQSRAARALATPAGRSAEFFNITSRENDTFDFLFETLTRAPERGDRAIGQGFEAPNAVTVQLDCEETLARLAQMGHAIAPPERRICHWSSYTRPGALRFYKGLLRQPQRSPLPLMQQALPDTPSRRWSRLLAGRPLPRPQPLWQQI
ncbi:alpha/beta hydrolase [Phaeobacter sp. HF9A]|uniref:alpha/beta hydrolase n=1 Tax=Phaeobacter sp. HF9A TaxID=2721561 RepID=UPI00143033AD|nr:alpha/beta hydrolase [Phaeobacter sp. HF9A]NIZ14164.1 alpha/beta hydrolase [Phaeobacter sp. HF9A]